MKIFFKSNGISLNRLTDWQKRDAQYLSTAKERWVYILGSGLFFILFMIYFKPFGVTNYDPNFEIDLAFVGLMSLFGFVVMLFLAFSEIVIRPFLFKTMTNGKLLIWFVLMLIIIATVSFLLYNLLGNWHDFTLKSYFEFIANVAAMGVLPICLSYIYFEYKGLKTQHFQLSIKTKNGHQKITFESDNQKERVLLNKWQLLYLESQDNYVAVWYFDQQVKKKLIRSSLKKIMKELDYGFLVRCHRSYLVNLDNVTYVSGNNHGLSLTLNNMDAPLSVSRKYVMDIRDKINALASRP